MTTRLHVRLFGCHVGELAMVGEVRAPEDWRFAYAQDYLDGDAPVPLSVSLPLQAKPFVGAVVRNWFGNLLPEGAVREAVAARLRIQVWDDFELLAAIGGECAGAVSVTVPGAVAPAASEQAKDLEALLAVVGDDMGEASLALIGTPQRLSLAGAQDKIAVVQEADGSIRLPEIGEITTHILKPESLRIRGLRDLEAFGLALARACGLRVAASSILMLAGHKALLVERYDRQTDTHGHRARLHQEDFCQALGYPGEMKYESHGGPSLARCAQLIRQELRLGPAAVQGLLDWVVFNAVIGNADAHAKNLALLCGPDGRRQLAPFYDLVPTLAISEQLVERAPALRIGQAERIDAVSSDDWRLFARATGYAPRFVLARVVELAGLAQQRSESVGKNLMEQGADVSRIANVLQVIQQNTERLHAALAS